MTELNVDGMALAPGVVETIVSIAANEVEGVACIGPSTTSGLRSVFGSKPTTQGIEITVGEDDKLQISIRVDVYYGFVLPDLAASIRQAISDAVTSQVGIPVGAMTCTSTACSSPAKRPEALRIYMAAKRHERTSARRAALQVLYTSEITDESPAAIAEGNSRLDEDGPLPEYALKLVLGVESIAAPSTTTSRPTSGELVAGACSHRRPAASCGCAPIPRSR